MGRLKRRANHHGVFRTQRARDRVDGRHLQCWRSGSSGGSRPGQPLGQQGLPGTGRPVQKQVVATSRRHLDRQPGCGLTADIDEVGAWWARLRSRPAPQPAPAPVPAAPPPPRQVGYHGDLGARHERRLRAGNRRRPSAESSPLDRRDAPWAAFPRTGRTVPSRPSSPISTRSTKGPPGSASKAARQAQASARSKPLPRLRTEAGDRLTVTLRLCQLTAVDDRRPDPVPRLPNSGVSQPDQSQPREPGGGVDLDVDHVPRHAGQRHRVSASPSSSDGPADMLDLGAPPASQHTDEIDPDLARVHVVGAQPAGRKPP